MAIYSSNSGNNWTLSLKIVLISTGVLSMAVALKLSAPTVVEFVASDVPSLWSFAHSWLKPPYLYVVINCIIISIVASSKLQQKLDHPSPPATDMEIPPLTGETVKISSEVSADDSVFNGVVLSGYGYGYDPNEVAKISVTENPLSEPVMVKEAKKQSTAVMDGGDEAVAPTLARIGLQRKDSLEYSFTNGSEKPPVSARFSHRKAAKASPEGGKALRVSKPKRQDTLENTWKTITEGRSMPLTRHLKKSDTWESHVRRNGPIDQTTPPPKMMKKSETFPDRSSANSPLRNSPGSRKLRKEPSLSQDELNRRVEAFINKFNEEMRLQRQESLNKYQEMIRRGAH